MNASPTIGQSDVIEFVTAFREEHPYGPTYCEISRGLSVAVGTVRQRIRSLEKRGLLERDESVARSLRLKMRSCKSNQLG